MKTPKQIKEAYQKLVWAFDAQNTNWPEKLFELCQEEERGHRGFMDGFERCHDKPASVADMGRMFAVHRIAEYMTGAKYPGGQDYLHTQKSCFLAAGIVDEYREKIAEAWKDEDVQALADLDYCDYVKVRREAVAA